MQKSKNKFPRFLILMLCVCLCITGCGQEREPELSLPLVSDEAPLTLEQLNQLSLQLLQAAPAQGNYAMDTLTVATMLLALRTGATDQTAQQIDQLLGFTSDNSLSLLQQISARTDEVQTQLDGVVSGIVTMSFGEGPQVLEQYITDVRSVSNVDIQMCDLSNEEQCAKLNNLLALSTNGHTASLIEQEEEAVPGITAAAASCLDIILAEGFDPVADRMLHFTDETGADQMVTMMGGSFDIPLYQKESIRCAFLPLNDDTHELWLIMPTGDRITNFVQHLDMEQLLQWRHDAHSTEVIIRMPRLALSWSSDATQLLTDMGMNALFDAQTAQLTNINEKLYVDKCYISSFFGFSGTGTATAADPATTINTPGICECSFDQPFVALVVDVSQNAILYGGVLRQVE